MDTNLSKIQELILKSELPLNEKEDLIILFCGLNDQDLESMLNLFVEDPDWINKFSNNYQTKKIAMKLGNTDLWKKIIEEEKEQLEKLEK